MSPVHEHGFHKVSQLLLKEDVQDQVGAGMGEDTEEEVSASSRGGVIKRHCLEKVALGP